MTATTEQKVEYLLRGGYRPFPIRIENRQPGMRYAVFPGTPSVCVGCGELVHCPEMEARPFSEKTSLSLAHWTLQHGDNREAVYQLPRYELTPEEEAKMAEWVERVHEYERRRKQ